MGLFRAGRACDVGGLFKDLLGTAWTGGSASGCRGLGFSGFRVWVTWTPKVCKIMALMAVIMGLGLLFYVPLGFRVGSTGLFGFEGVGA